MKTMTAVTTKALAFLSVLALLLGAGCASKSDLEALQRQVRTNRVEVDHRLQDMDQRLGEKVQPVQARQAESWAELEQMKLRLNTMQGQVDGLNSVQQSQKAVNIHELARQVEAMRLALSSQLGVELASPEGAAHPEAPEASAAKTAIATDPKPAAPAAAPAPAPPAHAPAKAEAADPAQALYDRALEAFNAKKYDDSQRYFSEFATTFPKHANVSNAVFWRGEAFYQMGKYPEAALEYENVKSKYPKSPKYASALLKQGMCFYKLNKKDAGKYVLEDLIKQFPNSAEAKRAKAFMQNPN